MLWLKVVGLKFYKPVSIVSCTWIFLDNKRSVQKKLFKSIFEQGDEHEDEDDDDDDEHEDKDEGEGEDDDDDDDDEPYFSVKFSWP